MMKTLLKSDNKRVSTKVFLCVFLVLTLHTGIFTPIKLFAQSVTITIKVNLVNNPPVLDPIPDITVHGGDKVTFAPTASDADFNNLNFSYSGWMNDSVYTTNINDAGNNDASEHFVTVTVSDGALTDSQGVKVTVCKDYSPLRCINIKPEGTDGMTSANRIFRAYPGIEYNIRAAILGGMYPYQFTWEANKPSWLFMDEKTGKISGIPPTAGFYNNITIKITDSKGSSITAQWSIEVTTQKFIFLDAVNGSPSLRNGGAGTGTISNPLRGVKDWYGTTSDDRSNFIDYQDYFVYYRTGTYYLDGYLDANKNMSCDGSKPSVHLAYPGESPIFDMENGKTWEAPVYIDGIEFYNMLGYGIIILAGNNYYTFRNLYMHDLEPAPGINGQSFISVMADSSQGNYWAWQDCRFDSSSQNGIEINNLDNLLIEDCVFTNFFTNNLDTTAVPAHPIFPNVECRNLTIRHNTVYGNEGKGVFAYLSAANSDINKRSSNIEICFNNIHDCAEAGLSVNAGANGILGFYAYRNTIQSNTGKDSIRIENAGKNPPEGPYVFENNIIVNPSSKYFVFLGCSADVMSYVNINNNLFDSATNNIVDPAGNITPSNTQYFGTFGWQKINEINQTIPAASAQSLSTNEDKALNITLSGTDPDGNILTYSIVTPPANGTLTGTVPNIVYTPKLNYNGIDSFTFKANDGYADSDTAKVSITINPVNDTPILMPIGNKIVEGASIEFTINAYDVDNDTLAYSAGNLPAGADFNPATRTFTWVPGYNQASLNYTNILFIVTDSGMPPASSIENITITVGNINTPPVLNTIGNKIAKEEELLEFTVTGYDNDGDNLTYAASNLPAGADFDPVTQTFSWTPGNGQSSNYLNILFTVSDNNIPPETDSESITITVGNINRAPVLNPIGNKIVKEGGLLEFVITGSDEDSNILTYSAGNLPKGAKFDSSSQKFSWYPGYNQAGNYENILFTVKDNGVPPISSSKAIIITVGDVNRPQVLNPIGNKKIKAEELLVFTVSGSDVDGDMLIYSAINLPSGADFNPSTQTFTWIPKINQAGIYSNIRFLIDDGTSKAYEEISINVEPLSRKEATAFDCDLDQANSLRRIDGMDLFVLSIAFGSEPDQINWNPAADINKDGIVNGEDLIAMCNNFGKKY